MKSLDCSGEHPRLQVAVGEKTLNFEFAEPEKVILKHDGASTFDFACGPQKAFKVSIEYVPAQDPGEGATGAVRRLEF